MRKLVREAVLYESLPGGRTRCQACARRCVAAPGQAGICGVRVNEDGRLMAPWGFVSGAALDPIEKKPFFHVLPGALAFSFGMYGCNLRCSFCQNWHLSTAAGPENDPEEMPAELIVSEAAGLGAAAVVSTYNEPLITAEWAAAVFSKAKEKGLRTGFVSNGYATAESVAFMKPRLDMWKVDLKSMDAAKYREVCGADLKLALEGLGLIKDSGVWLEVVTLLIPGFNDSDAEVAAMADHLRGLSPDIPWHLTAFHPAHRLRDAVPTPPDTLLRARDIALKKGLRFVYCGNLPLPMTGAENTFCPACGRMLVERGGYTVTANYVKGGACPCGQKIPGIWWD